MYLLLISILLASSPPYSTEPWETSETNLTTDFCAFDYDNDGDIDLAFCDYSWPAGGSVKLYRNDNGQLTGPVWESGTLGGCSCLAAGDYDNDGDIDLAVGMINIMPQDGMNVIYKNSADETIIPFSTYPVWISDDHRDTIYMQFADIDRDGLLELLTANIDNRICLYDNTAFGMEHIPADPFNMQGIATNGMMEFKVSRFSDNLTTQQYSQMQDLHLICSWIPRFFTGVYTNIAAWDPPSFNPLEPEYASFERFSTGSSYLCFDLNQDDLMDWLTFNNGGLTCGLSEDWNQLTFALNSVTCTGYNMTHAVDVSISRLSLISDDIYIAIAGRGYKIPSSSIQSGFENAQDVIFVVDSWNPPIVADPIWTSDSENPTLSIGFADFYGDPQYIENHTYNTTLACANQTIVFPEPINTVNSIILNEIILQHDEYHLDLMNGQISLIGGELNDQLIVNYATSRGNDLICARNGRNAVYYHD